MNILLEFSAKQNIKSIIIDDLEKHVNENWFRLVDSQRKNNKIRILSTENDIFDVINDFKGKYFLKWRIIK